MFYPSKPGSNQASEELRNKSFKAYKLLRIIFGTVQFLNFVRENITHSAMIFPYKLKLVEAVSSIQLIERIYE